jgi:hypothetical protein
MAWAPQPWMGRARPRQMIQALQPQFVPAGRPINEADVTIFIYSHGLTLTERQVQQNRDSLAHDPADSNLLIGDNGRVIFFYDPRDLRNMPGKCSTTVLNPVEYNRYVITPGLYKFPYHEIHPRTGRTGGVILKKTPGYWEERDYELTQVLQSRSGWLLPQLIHELDADIRSRYFFQPTIDYYVIICNAYENIPEREINRFFLD